MVEQSRLADSGFTAEDQDSALPATYSRDELIKHLALARTVQQPRPWKVVVQHRSDDYRWRAESAVTWTGDSTRHNPGREQALTGAELST